ncbi:MAG: DUF6221 family protein [Kineosporiaceae bacterium]
MDIDSGLEPDLEPNLDEFLLARIAEDKRIATDAAAAAEEGGASPAPGAAAHGLAEHVAHFAPARILAECSAKRRLVLACRDARPDLHFLGRRTGGQAAFPLVPQDEHQLAAVTLALLALPYAGHHDYRPEWRP